MKIAKTCCCTLAVTIGVAAFAPGTEIVRRDGTKVPAAAYADYFWLDPGDAAIFSSLTATP